jgi:hypothetical protein
MNLQTLNEILNTVSVARIDNVVIDVESDAICVRGADVDKSVVVFSKRKNDIDLPATVGINRLGVLINRIKMFNLDKAKVVSAVDRNFTRSITISEGRRKVSFQFADPAAVRAPKSLNCNKIINKIVLTKDRMEEINKAVAGTQASVFTLMGSGNDVILKLVDPLGDVYEDVIGENDSGSWSTSWRVDKFMSLSRYELKTKDSILMEVSQKGFLYLTVGGIEFALLPQITK